MNKISGQSASLLASNRNAAVTVSETVEASHTPGPWQAEYGEGTYVLATDRSRVCTINWLRGPHGSFGRILDDEGEANARLIAAAPDMLAALKIAQEAIAWYGAEKFEMGGEFAGQAVAAAISKTEGRS